MKFFPPVVLSLKQQQSLPERQSYLPLPQPFKYKLCIGHHQPVRESGEPTFSTANPAAADGGPVNPGVWVCWVWAE